MSDLGEAHDAAWRLMSQENDRASLHTVGNRAMRRNELVAFFCDSIDAYEFTGSVKVVGQ
ncbi:hypothetical protein [Halorubrum lacusprofundi]|uniref:hypothetical protein n=1 Tax=Halorubrum lacusprofundi TaxID=2247 RepID=UPI000B5A88E8|nr:hypothetical protein [Halorubrum lacusprofundi]